MDIDFGISPFVTRAPRREPELDERAQGVRTDAILLGTAFQMQTAWKPEMARAVRTALHLRDHGGWERFK